MKTYLGIDLGGTNVRVAKVTRDGIVLAEVKRPSLAQEGPRKVMDNMMEMIREIPGYTECEGIGVGVPGPVDTINGKMLMATNLPGFEQYPIAAELTQNFNMPAYVDNDANVAGLAEALVGAGKGLPVVYYVTISTGIGGALIVDGKVVSGKHGHAGEIANIIIDRNREKVNHLNIGAVENEASGVAITRKGKALFGDQIRHAGDVFDLAKQGNPQAQSIVDNMAYDLAVMFSVIAHIADPWMFVIGGGMMQSKDVFMDKVVANFKNFVHVPMRDTLFETAKLEEPGIIGAAMLPISHGN